MNPSLNIHGDTLIQAGPGLGADIASQRQDQLDTLSIDRASSLAGQGAAPMCLDLGSGRGAQSARLLDAGAAYAIAVDQADFHLDFAELSKRHQGKAKFIHENIANARFFVDLAHRAGNRPFDIVIFQRTLHYFRHPQAVELIEHVRDVMRPTGRLYLSASGLDSELGIGYEHADTPIHDRFAPLSPQMAAKHGIEAPVCLYRQAELEELCRKSGLRVLLAQESEFGNIKIVAEPL